MLLTLAALAGTLFAKVWRPESARFPAVILPMLCGLFLAPLMTMICRSTLAGMIFSGTVMAVTWFVTLAIAWFGFGVEPEAAEHMILGRWTLAMIVLCPLAGLLGWRRFAQLEATETASPALQLPRWLRSAHGARLHSPLHALAVKEVHLQQWRSSWLVSTSSGGPSLWAATLHCIAGDIPGRGGDAAVLHGPGHHDWSARKRRGTTAWHGRLAVAPAHAGLAAVDGEGRRRPRLALLLGVGLPVLLIQLTPHDGFRAIRMSADLTVLIVLLTASSVYISSLSSSGVRAMVLSLPIGMAVAYFVQMVSRALRWVTLQLAGPLMADIVTGAIAPSSVDPADVVIFAARAFSLTLAPLLLWFGFVNHTSPERTVRRIFQQVASIAFLITTGIVLVAGVLAFYELRSR